MTKIRAVAEVGALLAVAAVPGGTALALAPAGGLGFLSGRRGTILWRPMAGSARASPVERFAPS